MSIGHNSWQVRWIDLREQPRRRPYLLEFLDAEAHARVVRQTIPREGLVLQILPPRPARRAEG
jgi:hypothetical protein